MKDLILNLKENSQDFEFYPTTQEIVQSVYTDLAKISRSERSFSCLDIGCGDGNFFRKFDSIRSEIKEFHKANNIDEDSYYYTDDKKSKPIANIYQKYAIEKSEILISNMPSNVVVVGTDFWEQTLIDKEVDIIFSNPPYSQFEDWTAKIIRESFCKAIYLVIPERWENSKEIKAALRVRKLEAEVLGEFDFLDAERAARAKVHLIKVTTGRIKYNGEYYDREKKNDPFEVWFNSEFKVDLKEDAWSERKSKEEKGEQTRKEHIKNEIVKGRDLVQVLTALYQQEMSNLLNNYKKVAELDGALLKELGVELKNIREGLKTKISGLKTRYWHEFFNNFDNIKKRLIQSKRSHLLNQLQGNTSVDFTESNIYAIVIWTIKNSNKYFDDQVKEIYLELTEQDYVKKYKSNQKTWNSDRWRYKKDETKNTHYSLDYRIITHRGSSTYQSQLISDVETIAANLGFNYIGDVKKFQNGNVHFKFEKAFIKAFNIEAARLFGWIKSPQEAVNEFHDDCKVNFEEAEKHFKANFSINSQPKQFLLN